MTDAFDADVHGRTILFLRRLEPQPLTQLLPARGRLMIPSTGRYRYGLGAPRVADAREQPAGDLVPLPVGRLRSKRPPASPAASPLPRFGHSAQRLITRGPANELAN